jgi:ABC-2 type transport system ATP-binding protein
MIERVGHGVEAIPSPAIAMQVGSDPGDQPGARAVQVTALVRDFGSPRAPIRAVDNLDLQVHTGEIYGFLGPNGAGKTTLVRILTTLLRPTSGSALVAGYDVVREADAVRRSIGVALQEAAIDPLMTGRELLHMQGALHGLRRAEARERATSLLDRVGLTDAGDRRVGGYSGGMRRRLDLALALVHRPVVLFLDEPTTGLDPTSRAALWREVRSLNDEGTTVFLTTQYLEEAEQLADRVGIIAGGRLVAEGTPKDLKARVGEPTLHIELTDPQAAPRAREALAGLGTLEPPRPEAPTRLALRSGAGKGAIAPAVQALQASGIQVESVEVENPSLDDVFAAVTGSTLEGAAAESSAA